MTAANPQRVSLDGAKFICCREALVTRAYPDGEFSDGTPRWSLAFGSQSPRVKEGDTTTIEEAFPRLREDIASREPDVNRRLKVELPQHQFDMLFSLYYQSGTTALREVAALFNAGEPIPAIAHFLTFNTNAKGAVKDGLTRRRIKEMGCCEDGHYGDLSRYPYYDGDPHKVERQYRPFPEAI